MGLQNSASSALVWSGVSQVLVNLSRFIVGLVLARVLAPEDFGLLALIAVLAAILQTITDGGLTVAILQRKDLSDEDVSTVFWFNLSISVLLASFIALSASYVSGFFENEELVPLIRVMGVTLIFSALSSTQRSLLSRKLAFKELLKITYPSFVIGAIVGIGMALAGAGVWSLLGQLWFSAMSEVFLLWHRSKWRPAFTFNKKSFREMFAFGSRNALERLIDVTVMEIYTLVIGKLFLPSDLGFYHRANTFQKLPAQNVHQVVHQVMFPLLSRIQGEGERLKKAFRATVRFLAAANFALFIGLAVTAEPMIVSLIGEKWLPSVPYLQILCGVGLLWPFQSLNVSSILAAGKSALSLKLAIVKRGAILLAILFTFNHGIIAMLWGQLVCSIFAFILNTWPNRKLVTCSIEAQLRIMVPYLLAALVMGAAVFCLIEYMALSPELEFAIGVTSGMVIYSVLISQIRHEDNKAFSEVAGKYKGCKPIVRLLFPY